MTGINNDFILLINQLDIQTILFSQKHSQIMKLSFTILLSSTITTILLNLLHLLKRKYKHFLTSILYPSLFSNSHCGQFNEHNVDDPLNIDCTSTCTYSFIQILTKNINLIVNQFIIHL